MNEEMKKLYAPKQGLNFFPINQFGELCHDTPWIQKKKKKKKLKKDKEEVLAPYHWEGRFEVCFGAESFPFLSTAQAANFF